MSSDETSPKQHICQEPNCGRSFTRKYTLMEHMKTHTGEKPHVCPYPTCGKRFSTSGNLSRHKRLHGEVHPVECPVPGCHCVFPSDNKLEKHMQFHLGSNVQVCKVFGCGKTFSTTGNLNRHMKQHHPDIDPESLKSSSPTNGRQHDVVKDEPMDTMAGDQGQGWLEPADIQELVMAAADDAEEKVFQDVDMLASILDEEVAPCSSPASSGCASDHTRMSVLDDMINFHVQHFESEGKVGAVY